jgi:hypothetical protein
MAQGQAVDVADVGFARGSAAGGAAAAAFSVRRGTLHSTPVWQLLHKHHTMYERDLAGVPELSDFTDVPEVELVIHGHNAVLLFPDRLTENLVGKVPQLLLALVEVSIATSFCETTLTTAARLHGPLLGLLGSRHGSDDSSLEPDTERLRETLRSISRLRLHLRTIVGEVVNASHVAGGRPLRDAVLVLSREVTLDTELTFCEKSLESLTELATIAKADLDLGAQLQQFTKLQQIINGSAAVRLVGVIGAVILTILTLGQLWASFLALPSSSGGGDQPFLIPGVWAGLSLSLLFLLAGALGGTLLWLGSNTLAKSTDASLSRRHLWVVLGIETIALVLAVLATAFWSPASRRVTVDWASARPAVLLTVVCVALTIVAVVLLARLVRRAAEGGGSADKG